MTQLLLIHLQYFYSIKDISIGGRCFCNGHASTCDTLDSAGRLQCTCEHNTCGAACDECCPGFVQKRWKPATLESSNECERKYSNRTRIFEKQFLLTICEALLKNRERVTFRVKWVFSIIIRSTFSALVWYQNQVHTPSTFWDMAICV